MAFIDKFKIIVESNGAEELSKIDRAAYNAGISLNKLGKIGIGVAAGLVASFGAMAKNVMNVADTMSDLGGTAGMTAGKIWQMSIAAEAAGGSFDQVEGMLLKFSKGVDAALQGNDKLIDSFARVGVSTSDLQNLSSEELFNKVAAGLGNMEDGAQKTALAMQLLGKSAATTDLAAFAEMTSKGVDPNLEKSIESAAAAVGAMETAFRTMQMAVLAAIGPVMEEIAKMNFTMEDAMGVANTIAPVFKAVFGVVAEVVGLAIRNFKELGVVLALAFGPGMIAQVVKMTQAMRLFAASNPFTLIAMAIGTVVIIISDLIKKYGSFGNASKAVGNAAIDTINRMISGYRAFANFIGRTFAAIGKAILAGLNPFSNQSATEVIKSGFNDAMNGIKRDLNRQGPIKFRFAVDPVPARGERARTTGGSRGVNDIQSPAAGINTARKTNSLARDTAEQFREQAENARRVTEELIRQNQAQNDARRLQISLIGQDNNNIASFITSDAEALREFNEQALQLQQQITESIAKGNKELTQELQRQLEVKENQLKITKQLNEEELRAKTAAELQKTVMDYNATVLRVGLNERQQTKELNTEIMRLNGNVSNAKLAIIDFENAAARALNPKLVEQFRLEVKLVQQLMEAGIIPKAPLPTTLDEATKKLDEARRILSEMGAEAVNARAETDAMFNELMGGYLKLSLEHRTLLREMQVEQERFVIEGKILSASFESYWAGALAGIKRQLDQSTPFRVMENSVISVFNNMNSAIDEFVRNGKFSFKSFARSIIADIIAINLKAQASNLLGSLFGIIGIPGIPGRATGGPVTDKKPYLVGENGPELFVPNSMGSIISNHQLNKPSVSPSNGVNQTTVVNNYNISALDSKSVAEMFMKHKNIIYGAAKLAERSMPMGA